MEISPNEEGQTTGYYIIIPHNFRNFSLYPFIFKNYKCVFEFGKYFNFIPHTLCGRKKQGKKRQKYLNSVEFISEK